MRTLSFSNNDQMPRLGLGTWKSGTGEIYQVIREAINIGYRHFDCAPRYENEPEIGQALHEAIKAGDVTRKDLWITSKLWNNAHLREDFSPALETTLRDLQLEYLDLYLIHWPVALKPEIIFPDKGEDFLSLQEAPLLDTWHSMIECRDAGFSKHIGVSNFSIKKIQMLIDETGITPESNQLEMHPFLQLPAMLQFCHQHQINLTAYSPLGSLDRPAHLIQDNEPRLLEHPVIKKIASDHAATPAQIIIRWAIQRSTAVIPKSSNFNRLKENFEAQNIQLAEADMREISGLDQHYRFINGNIWTISGSPYTIENLWDEVLPK